MRTDITRSAGDPCLARFRLWPNSITLRLCSIFATAFGLRSDLHKGSVLEFLLDWLSGGCRRVSRVCCRWLGCLGEGSRRRSRRWHGSCEQRVRQGEDGAEVGAHVDAVRTPRKQSNDCGIPS